MYLSDFNYYFDCPGGLFIFNSLASKEVFVKTDIKRSSLSFKSQNLIKVLQKLNCRDFLQRTEVYDRAEIQSVINDSLKTDYMYVKVLTTYDCNMACIYCYENNNLFSRITNHETLSPERCENIISMLNQNMQKAHLKKIYFSWYGGEPLLNYNAILTISKGLMKLGYEVQAEATSNLLVLEKNPTLIYALKVAGIKLFSVTLDGYGDYHNKRRPMKNHKSDTNEYKLTCELISYISEYFSVVVMLMINKNNINQTDMILDSLNKVKNKQNIHIFIGMLENISDCLSDPMITETVSFQELTGIRCVLYKKFWDAGFPESSKYLLGLHGNCLAVTDNSCIITPEGYITRCPDSIGDKNLYTGILKRDKIIANHDSLWKWANPIDDAKCQKCHMLPACLGGCTYTYIKSGKRNCQFYSRDGINIQNEEALEFSLKYCFLSGYQRDKID